MRLASYKLPISTEFVVREAGAGFSADSTEGEQG